MRKLVLPLILVLFLSTFCFGDNKQVITSTDGATLISAQADKYIVIKAVAIFATSTTSVSFTLSNDDNYLFGDASTGMIVDLDGGDGPAGFIMPYNEHGWFVTDTKNEAVTIGLSGETKVIVVIMYSYL